MMVVTIKLFLLNVCTVSHFKCEHNFLVSDNHGEFSMFANNL